MVLHRIGAELEKAGGNASQGQSCAPHRAVLRVAPVARPLLADGPDADRVEPDGIGAG
jgi:hypothetical protein